MKPAVVLTHWVHPTVLEFLAARCQVLANDSRLPLPREELLARARHAEAIIAFMTDRVDDGFLAACPKLRMVADALKGVDNFDIDAPGMVSG